MSNQRNEQHDSPSSTGSSVAERATVALVQMSCVELKSANVEKALARIAEAAAAGANVVCLQELFAGLYPCQSEDHRPVRRGGADPRRRRAKRLAAAARQHGVAVVGSLFERRAPGMYHNTAVVFDADGRLAGMYRKMHIPDDPLYYEKFYFTPGDLGFRGFRHRFRPARRAASAGINGIPRRPA